MQRLYCRSSCRQVDYLPPGQVVMFVRFLNMALAALNVAAAPLVAGQASEERRKESFWCVGRQGDVYNELLLLTRVGSTTCLDSPDIEELFRGSLDHPIQSSLEQRGRRNFAFLPREDVRLFEQAASAACIDLAPKFTLLIG